MGKYASERMVELGHKAKKITDAVRMPPEGLNVPGPGKPMHDPRSLWPLESSFTVALESKRVDPIVTCRANGTAKPDVIDGTRTTMHLCDINVRRLAVGLDPLWPMVRFVNGTDEEMKLLRLQLNAERRADTASTLAYKFADLYAAGAGTDMATIATAACVSTDLVRALLCFPSFSVTVKEALERDLPVEAALAFADIPREEHEGVLASVMAQLGHLPSADRTPRKVKAAVKEAMRDEPVTDRAKGLPRKKLERVWEMVEDHLETTDPLSMLTTGAEWLAFTKGLRLAVGGDLSCLEGLPDDLIATVKGAMAKQKPGRKPGKKEADGE